MTKATAESCRQRAETVTAKADAANDYATMLIYDGLAREWLRLASLFEARPEALNPVDAHVGERLRQRRCELGLSRADLSDLCRISAAQIESYEEGWSVVPAAILWRFSQGLKRPIEFFYPSIAP